MTETLRILSDWLSDDAPVAERNGGPPPEAQERVRTIARRALAEHFYGPASRWGGYREHPTTVMGRWDETRQAFVIEVVCRTRLQAERALERLLRPRPVNPGSLKPKHCTHCGAIGHNR